MFAGAELVDVTVRGTLGDGRTYSHVISSDPLVGREASEDDFGEQCFVGDDGEGKQRWWIKCKLGEGEYLGSVQRRFQCLNAVLRLKTATPKRL